MKNAFWLVLVLILGSSLLNHFKKDEPYNRRDDLITRVDKFSNNLLFENEKKQIKTMLEEVTFIKLFHDPEDLGGQITGQNKNTLMLGKKLFDENDFYMKRNLMIVLYHESRHWQDLKLERFLLLKSKEPTNIDDKNEYISKMALLEYFAYKEQHKLTIRFNEDNPKFLLPKCAEFKGDGSKKSIEVTAELFGFGRSLFSNYNAISSDRRLNKSDADKKFLKFMAHYKNNFPETAQYKNRFLIDCNHKYGF